MLGGRLTATPYVSAARHERRACGLTRVNRACAQAYVARHRSTFSRKTNQTLSRNPNRVQRERRPRDFRERNDPWRTRSRTPALSDEQRRGAARSDQGRRQRRAQAHGARSTRSRAPAALGIDPARRADPAGLLLRHAGPDAEQAAASSSARGASRARATTRSSSCARSSRRSFPPSCAARRTSASRSTRCPAASSARAR